MSWDLPTPQTVHGDSAVLKILGGAQDGLVEASGNDFDTEWCSLVSSGCDRVRVMVTLSGSLGMQHARRAGS